MPSNRRRFRLGLLLAAILASAPSTALAADTPQDRAEAKRLYAEAKKLRGAGKDAEALELFRRAHDLMATPVLRLELAQALEKQGKWIEAHALLVSVSAMPVSPTETQKGKAARDEAKTAAAALALRIPKVTFVVSPAGAETKVAVDGQELSNELLTSLALDPGDHRASARRGALSAEQAFTLAEGEQRTIEMNVPVPPPEPTAPAPETAPPKVVETPKVEPAKPAVAPPPLPVKKPDEGAPSRGVTPLVPIALSVGAAGLAIGIGTGAVALSQVGSLLSGCPNALCPGEYQDLLATHHALTTTSTVAFSVGGGAAAIGLVAWLVDGSRRPATAPKSAPKSGSLGLVWTGTGVALNGAW